MAFAVVTYGVPKSSILGPLLFLIYANGLTNVSKALDAIMFADNKNLLSSSNDIATLFSTVSNALEKISFYFVANRLSLNIKKRVLLNRAPTSIHLDSAHFNLHPAHFGLHPGLCTTLNVIRFKISQVIGQFPHI